MIYQRPNATGMALRKVKDTFNEKLTYQNIRKRRRVKMNKTKRNQPRKTTETENCVLCSDATVCDRKLKTKKRRKKMHGLDS